MSACSSCSQDGKYYVGDIGTEIIVDTCSDISAASLVKLIVEKPDGSVHDWSGTVFEVTKIRHVVATGDFDMVGEYSVQAYVEISGWKGRGTVATFKVSNAIS